MSTVPNPYKGKLGRNYLLGVQLEDTITIDNTVSGPAGDRVINTLAIEPPITITFDVQRKAWSSQNDATIEIYNLSLKNRNSIRFDNIAFASYRQIILQAGYQDFLSTIFIGNIMQAYSVRDGVNFITTIVANDGGYAFVNSEMGLPYSSGTPYTQVFSDVVSKMPGVSIGAIGNSFLGLQTKRDQSVSGNCAEVLQQLSVNQFFVDNGKAYFLGSNECLPANGITEINSDSGLLNTPTREQNMVVFDMIFEPRLRVGQIINLKSSTDPNFNGPYKIWGLTHRGMISPTVCGEAITTVELDNSKNTLLGGTANLITVKELL